MVHYVGWFGEEIQHSDVLPPTPPPEKGWVIMWASSSESDSAFWLASDISALLVKGQKPSSRIIVCENGKRMPSNLEKQIY